MDELKKTKRIKMQLKQPNLLFEQWLEEWLQNARETNSKLQYSYSKALTSLKKYPLPLNSGADCRILEGFGVKLCSMLDKKLSEHKDNQKSSPKRNSHLDYCPAFNSGPYALLITLHKSTNEPNYKGFLFKDELIKLAQPLSDKSFTKCEPGSYYNAWSSMKTLLEKGFITKIGSPAKYSLTDVGITLGMKLYDDTHKKENTVNILDDICIASHSDKLGVTSTMPACFGSHSNKLAVTSNVPKDIDTCFGSRNNKLGVTSNVLASDFDPYSKACATTIDSKACASRTKKVLLPKSNSITSTTSTNSVLDEFILSSGTFDVILIVDTQETNGSGNETNDPFLSDLSFKNVKFEVRNLKVGDFAWIAKCRDSYKELILPYIIERKRVDDLAKSIKDGRFHEQKFRLKQSGIQNMIYLVESHGNNQHTGLPISSLMQAATNTLIQDRFQLKFTDNLRGTANYLAAMTKIIQELFLEKTLMSCLKQDLVDMKPLDSLVPLITFTDFNKAAAKNKNLRLKQLFVRQLLQLKGLSLDKALAIAEAYPTPLGLHVAYKRCSKNEGESLLSTIRFGDNKKQIGLGISKTIFLFCTLPKYN